jgi:hypothetical protein
LFSILCLKERENPFMSKTKQNWLFALVLTLPMVLFYLAYYFNHSSSVIPTGFIAYDNVSYVANAKQYLDSDHFSIFYSNPLNDSGNYPHIYFQTQTIILAFLLWIGFSPGFTIVLLNWLGALLSFRMVIGIYDHLYPSGNRRKLFISFFCWGGGLLALAGIPVALTKQMGGLPFLDRILFIDPAWGWWGLNFGRGHFISTEGYFHFLFLAGIFCILKKKWNLALIVSLLLCLSHPFTGIEYLSIIAGWVFIEKIIIRNKELPWKFTIGIFFILAFHVFYYLYYLNSFPEHHSVSDQYSLNWRLRYFNMVPAYCIVGALATASFLKLKKDFLRTDSTRLFLTWFTVAFLLANHEIFMKPMQPLHFTRGYVWTSLFLLGLPALHYLFQNEKFRNYSFALILFSVLFFSDNFLWILTKARFHRTSPTITCITAEQKNLLDTIANNSSNKTLLIGNDEVLVYMSTVFSKAYPWISHTFTTPFAARKEKAYRDFIEKGIIDSSWRKREAIFVFHKTDSVEMQRSQSFSFRVQTLASTQTYILQKASIP